MKRLLTILIAASLVAMPVLHPATQVSAASNSYVALGDSVAAGAGLAITSNGSREDTLCDRSPAAYPYEFAQANGLSLRHLACSGAKADEGIYDTQDINGTTIPEQLDAAFAQGTPDVISITIGANDVRWTQFVTQCLSSIDCDNTPSTTLFNGLLIDLRAELNWILLRINYHSNGNPPTVLLNGYYKPFTTTTCSDAADLTSSENRWLNQRINRLNSAMKTIASRYTYAQYVPVNFSGHGLCSSDPWIQGLNDAAPFHPTAAGQQAIAEANIAAYNKVRAEQPRTEPYSLRERFMGLLNRVR